MTINKISKKVAIVMGSQSDYPVMKKCEEILKILKIKYETKIISAHRTPDRMFEFAKTAAKNNFAVIVAGAGGSAHLPGMIASMSTLPVIGVPIETKKLKGLDSLLSIVQMPKGIPVGTVAIGENGAFNAGLLATSIIALSENKIKKNLEKWRRLQTLGIKKSPNKNG
jgi:5-(carboxyamino)imidazole ribonucleotide mutase